MGAFPIHGMLAKETHAGAVVDSFSMGDGLEVFNDGGYLGFSVGAGISLYNLNSGPNTEVMSIGSTGSAFYLGTGHTGTGVDRNILVQNWRFEPTPNYTLTPGVTNSYDIGSTARVVRNFFTAAINWMTRTAPASPIDGDMWFDGTGLKIRISGVTRSVNVT